MDTQTPVVADQVVNLRRGEILIVNCIGEPELYSSLTLGYNGTRGVLKKNKIALNYTWYCEIATDEPVEVWGFDSKLHNANKLVTIAIKSHDLDAILSSTQTNHPTSTESPTSTTESSAGGGLANPNQQNPPPTDESTAVKNYLLYGVLSFLGVVILALFITVLIMAVVIHRTKSKATTTVEDGENTRTDGGRGQNLCTVQNEGEQTNSGTGTDQEHERSMDSELGLECEGHGVSKLGQECQGPTYSGLDHKQSTVQETAVDQTQAPTQGGTDEADISKDDSIMNTSTEPLKNE